CHDWGLYRLTPLLRQRNIPANAADRRRRASTGRRRGSGPGPGRGRAAAGHPRVSRRARAGAALAERFHAAGFYRLVRPRELGGLQADPLTYLRTVELLSEGSGSVGWNLCNNNIAQLVTLGLPDAGIREIYAPG